MLNIIEKRNIPFTISGILCALSVLALLVFGLRPGIDFTGGSLLQVSFQGDRPAVNQIQETLSPLNLGSVLVQPSEDKIAIIKTRFVSEEEHQAILSALRTAFQTEEYKVIEDRIDTIGPAVSSHLRERAIYAAVAVIIAIVLYVAYAFRKVYRPVNSWKYGLAAIIALVHDVTITMGLFAVLGRFMGVEVDISFVVALLTILGYSVNDTIIVFDRIRERLVSDGPEKFAQTVNLGVNETISRSINTSFTTLLVLFALFFFGGDTIHYFTLALIVGISVGTYSSIFLASPLLVVWEKMGRKRI